MDVDAFFAQVEQLDNPELKGRPVVVGGVSDRGVVSTASYEARKFGVRSAMSSVVARKLCPECIFLRGNYRRYSDISKEIMSILRGYSDRIEVVSIDEAYLDVTGLYVSANFIAKRIKEEIKERLGLTVSVGISYNKFLAKLASEWDKPDGLFEIKKGDVPGILRPLPIIKIHGLGKKSVEKLNRIGIFTIGELLEYPAEALSYHLGSEWAKEIVERVNGIDNRQVGSHGERKSYGMERTYPEDIEDTDEIREFLYEYLSTMLMELESKGLVAKTLTVKIKFEDFESITRSHSYPSHTKDIEEMKKTIDKIIDRIQFTKGVRLLGVTLSNVEMEDRIQLSIFD